MWPLQECDPELITGDETLLVRHYDGSLNVVGGLRQATPYITFEMTCMVTPVMGQELLLMPESDRSRDWLTIYTNKQQQPLALGDLVQRGGWYQVQKLDDWGSFMVAQIAGVDAGAVA